MKNVMLLTPRQIAALTIAYNLYKRKKKIERALVEGIFYRTTGYRLNKKYYAIPIVRALINLSN